MKHSLTERFVHDFNNLYKERFVKMTKNVNNVNKLIITAMAMVLILWHGQTSWAAIDFNPTNKFIQENPYNILFDISKNLRKFFEAGNVIEFNKLRSRYPNLVIDLRNVHCNGRSLKNIDLSNVILKNSDFRGCYLEGAKFKNSYLAYTNFRSFNGFGETNLFYVDFTGAILQKQREIELNVDLHYTPCLDYIWGDEMNYRYECQKTRSKRRSDDYRNGYAYNSMANFENTDLSKSIDLTGLIPESSKIISLASSNKIFTGKFSCCKLESFESMEDQIKTFSANSSFVSDSEKENFVGKKYLVLYGTYYGSKSFNFINTNPNVVVILNEFYSHGYLKTAGDLIICNTGGMNPETQATGTTIYGCPAGE